MIYDHWSKKIYRPQMIVWSSAIIHPLRWSCCYHFYYYYYSRLTREPIEGAEEILNQCRRWGCLREEWGHDAGLEFDSGHDGGLEWVVWGWIDQLWGGQVVSMTCHIPLTIGKCSGSAQVHFVIYPPSTTTSTHPSRIIINRGKPSSPSTRQHFLFPTEIHPWPLLAAASPDFEDVLWQFGTGTTVNRSASFPPSLFSFFTIIPLSLSLRPTKKVKREKCSPWADIKGKGFLIWPQLFHNIWKSFAFAFSLEVWVTGRIAP